MSDIAIVGATGRMGKRLFALAPEYGFRVVAAITHDEHPSLGEPAREVWDDKDCIDVRYQSELRATPSVLIDFSWREATRRWLEICRQRRIPMLIGTTGLEQPDHDAIHTASREIPVLQSANMSLGIAVLMKLARDAAKMLGKCEIEIVETHHRTKKDAPSGTALALADALVRKDGSGIPIHSQRLGDEVGRHSIYLALSGERLELAHVATSRDTFAHGALRAAQWLAGQKPGRYCISDVLGI